MEITRKPLNLFELHIYFYFICIQTEESLTLNDVEYLLDDRDAAAAVTATAIPTSSEPVNNRQACTATNQGSKRQAARLNMGIPTTACPTTDAASSNRNKTHVNEINQYKMNLQKYHIIYDIIFYIGRNRQRISVQLQDARETFINIAETNSTALKVKDLISYD